MCIQNSPLLFRVDQNDGDNYDYVNDGDYSALRTHKPIGPLVKLISQ